MCWLFNIIKGSNWAPFFYSLFLKKIYYNIYIINKQMASRFININYPFKDSKKGFFLDLNDDDNQAIKADLLHLILTLKGQRLYKPDFGTDLLKFIFEPEDGMTFNSIKEEVVNTVKTYLPQLQIDDLIVGESDDEAHAAIVTIKYTVTDSVFQSSDIIVIKI